MAALTRRTLLSAAGAASLTTVLASCAGFTGGSPQSSGAAGTTTLTFTTWGSDDELKAYRSLIAKFHAAHRGVSIKLNAVPYAQMFTNIDAQLQAGNAPDIFRAGYGQIGGYASQGALLDLSTYFSSSDAAKFIPAFWRAVGYGGKPYGVPQQTDTSALITNTAMLKDAGVTALPDSLDSAWSWQEFDQVLAKLRSTLPQKQYPFADNWQLGGATRWATWLFNAGGRLLSPDLKHSAVESAAGTKALDYTRDFFAKRYVPANSSVKSNSYADTTWLAGTTALVSAGNFLLPEFAPAKFDWGVTYLPKDVRAADDLGGNALVATKTSKHPDLAAQFLSFMVTESAMTEFCAASLELPTLQNLVGRDLGWKVRKGLMPVFVDQATTITASDVAQLTVPAATAINTALESRLEVAFRQGTSTSSTLSALTGDLNKALAA